MGTIAHMIHIEGLHKRIDALKVELAHLHSIVDRFISDTTDDLEGAASDDRLTELEK